MGRRYWCLNSVTKFLDKFFIIVHTVLIQSVFHYFTTKSRQQLSSRPIEPSDLLHHLHLLVAWYNDDEIAPLFNRITTILGHVSCIYRRLYRSQRWRDVKYSWFIILNVGFCLLFLGASVFINETKYTETEISHLPYLILLNECLQ